MLHHATGARLVLLCVRPRFGAVVQTPCAVHPWGVYRMVYMFGHSLLPSFKARVIYSFGRFQDSRIPLYACACVHI